MIGNEHYGKGRFLVGFIKLDKKTEWPISNTVAIPFELP
jgi:hypothetical protein